MWFYYAIFIKFIMCWILWMWKRYFQINYKINLVAIYKSLSGTINTCGNECPTNCNYFNIFQLKKLDEPNILKICVKTNYKIVKLFDDYKGWDDGTFAISCE